MHFSQLLTRSSFAIATAVVLNVALFYLGHALGIMTDDVIVPQANNGPIPVIAVIMASIMPSLIATLIFWLLNRFTRNGSQLFQLISGVLVLASFYNPFTIPNVPTGYAIWLNLMHVVVAGSLVYFFTMWKKAD